VHRDDRVYVPLYHPAAALYNGSLRETLFADMRRVRTYLDEAEAARAPRVATAMTQLEPLTADQLSLFAQ
jgi:hypothetical protein